MFEPRGAVVRTMRLTETAVDADGTERTKSVAAGGVIVVVKPDSLSRRKFAQFCNRFGLIAHAAERAGGADGTYNRRTGAVETADRDEPKDFRQDPTVTAWQVLGGGAALSQLVGMDDEGRRGEPKPFVQSWHFALAVRVPVCAMGTGEEKPRPSSGTMFGRPETTKATAEQLAADRSKRLTVARNVGRI